MAGMPFDEQLRRWYVAVEVSADFSDATLVLTDQSKLVFRHKVGERSVRALAPDGHGQADQVLATIARFRLNAKHLDIEFSDGSRWELRFR